MKNKLFPPDQANVLFTDVNGVRREGKYVLEMNAYIEKTVGYGQGDCSNIFPENSIILWEFLDSEISDDDVITVL